MDPNLVKATYTVKYDSKGKTKRMIVSRVPVMGCLTMAFGLFLLLSYSKFVSENGHTVFNMIGLLLICGVLLVAAKLFLFKLIYTVNTSEITVTQKSLFKKDKVEKISIAKLVAIRLGP
jgi:hypothetical protein